MQKCLIVHRTERNLGTSPDISRNHADTYRVEKIRYAPGSVDFASAEAIHDLFETDMKLLQGLRSGSCAAEAVNRRTGRPDLRVVETVK